VRILHISTRLILGGSQENTVLSCEGQARLGHHVHLAFGPIYGPEGSLLHRVHAFRTDTNARIHDHTVPHLLRQLSPLADLRAFRELRDLIADLNPDIVHTHSSKAGILGRLAAHAARGHPPRRTPAIVHTIHGPPFMPVEGSPLKRLRRRTLNTLYTLAERAAARRCDAIVSVADAMTRQFLARNIGTPDQYRTIRSGMDVREFLPPSDPDDARRLRARVRRELRAADQDLLIGTVARLAEHKGHDDLLDALAKDLRAHPHWKLIWIGDGWWRDRLLARARAAGLAVLELDRTATAPAPPTSDSPEPPAASPAQLILTGLVPPARVAELLQGLDILAHPSYREGLPRTVPQALLAGVAPVAYDVDGTREACIDGHTGRLVAPGDHAGLRAAIADLARDPAQRARLAATGQAMCRDAFSADRMVAELDALYRSLLR
jgi:glycosyltransferase involved in cell wall biosynthesis